MRPVAELTATVRGVFSDVDDTLTHAGVVVPEAYAAIARARAAGLRVVLVTGRPAGWAEVLASVWPVDAAIAENGGVAYFKREGRVHRLDFDPGENAARLATLAAAVLRTFPFARRSDDSSLRITDAAFDVGENQHLSPEQVEAIVSYCRGLGARTLVSSVHAHACFHTADKALMAARVAEVVWGESADEVAANYAFIGDSPNDQAAFAFFATSIGVANVARFLPQLDPAPRYVTSAACGLGFAEAIDVLLGTTR
jgi:HAD superfamily hydrolase (TIGR01484 family)